MWQSQAEQIDRGVRLQLSSNGSPMSFQELFDGLATDLGFISWYTELLAGSNFVSFFWEHPALTIDDMQKDAEFVLIYAPALTGLRADQNTFASQFENAPSETVLVFDNLGGDARLVVPHAAEGAQSCAHLAPFVRAASAKLVCAFWQAVGKAVIESVSDAPVWLSTSGLGVSWLHARLDSRPKYYQYAPYKQEVKS